MDKIIEPSKRPVWQWAVALATVLVTGVAGARLIDDLGVRTYRAEAERLSIAEVTRGSFEDIAPIRGVIMPSTSVFLDAVDGGVVEEIFAEEGSFVEVGEPLLQLSNSSLQLQVANNDTQTTEQLNNLKNISNGFETTSLATQRELIETDFRIRTLQRQKELMTELARQKLVAQNEYESVTDELHYQKQLYENIQQRQEVEERIRGERMAQIDSQIQKLEENLQIAMRSFENLLVRAPVAGQLTSLPVEIGENKAQGQRLGQIDVVDEYKITAQVDEFYVTRVMPGHAAEFTLAGKQYQAVVDKVYPEIRQGTFTVDLVFDGDVPANVRRGQTLQLDLTLGSPVVSLLLPLGGFVQDTGGNWVFVLDPAAEYAVRRNIVTGRRNNQFIEVSSGLEAGEQVITSGYGQMSEMERIELIE